MTSTDVAELRQERAQRTRARILETAATAFAEHGYDGVSLNEVIRASGLTKGAFYFHFPSREALALAVFRHKQEQLLARMSDEMDDRKAPLDRLAEGLRVRARLLAEDPSLFVVVRLGIDLSARPAAKAVYAGFMELPVQALEAMVRDGQERGEMRRDLGARAVAEQIFAGILGMDQAALLLSGTIDVVERTEHLLAILLGGLAPRPPTEP
ncbi:MAG: TetR/AcrR family transcriptional regulator [Chloroflexota bacterium]